MSFSAWNVDDECIEFIFPPRNRDIRLSFTEFLWVETLTRIRNLPEVPEPNF
jgi:hypothetical protein